MTEEDHQKFIAGMIQELELQTMDPDEAEVICYLWMLRTKIYLVGETSHEWNRKFVKQATQELRQILEEIKHLDN